MSLTFAGAALPAVDNVFTSRMISVNVLSLSGAAAPEQRPSTAMTAMRKIAFMMNYL
jgi:hypothetical protein